MRARAPTAMRYVYARPCYTHDNDCVWVARALLLCTTNLSLQTIEHAITRLFGELSSVISHKKKRGIFVGSWREFVPLIQFSSSHMYMGYILRNCREADNRTWWRCQFYWHSLALGIYFITAHAALCAASCIRITSHKTTRRKYYRVSRPDFIIISREAAIVRSRFAIDRSTAKYTQRKCRTLLLLIIAPDEQTLLTRLYR